MAGIVPGLLMGVALVIVVMLEAKKHNIKPSRERATGKERWTSKNGVTFTEKSDMDIDSFKEAVDGVDEWFVNELKTQGYDDAQDLVDLFTK